MTLDEIRKNKPDGAQYYHSANFMYYMGVVNDLYFWSDSDEEWIKSNIFIEDVWLLKPLY